MTKVTRCARKATRYTTDGEATLRNLKKAGRRKGRRVNRAALKAGNYEPIVVTVTGWDVN